MWKITGAAVAVTAACTLTAVVLANNPVAGHSAVQTAKTKPARSVTGSPPVAAAPYYVVVNARFGTATVRRTATGAKIATVRRPHGSRFVAVAGSQDDKTFALAAQISSNVRFYKLRLSATGRPGRPVLTAVPRLPRRFGSCYPQLAGLAVSPNGRFLAYSVLSNCPTGNAGPGEILTARFGSGRTLAKFHPGDGYPQSLSWTATGSLAYSWTSTKMGVFIIGEATKAGASPRLLISSSASVGGFSGADFPLIAPDGSAVVATVARGSLTLAIAEFPLRGTARRLLTPAVRNPGRFCGPLWTDASGRRLLTGCGDNSEYEISDGHLTSLDKPWQLPVYAVPSGPLIAW